MSEHAAAVAIPNTFASTSPVSNLTMPAPPTTSQSPSHFLQLPAELRLLIYSSLSPYSSIDREHFGKAQHLHLIQTCRQIREEAPPEIQKTAEGFHRDYEKKWQETHGERIYIKEEQSWKHVSVLLDRRPSKHSIPLIELPFLQLDVGVHMTQDAKFYDGYARAVVAQVRCLKVHPSRVYLELCEAKNLHMNLDRTGGEVSRLESSLGRGKNYIGWGPRLMIKLQRIE